MMRHRLIVTFLSAGTLLSAAESPIAVEVWPQHPTASLAEPFELKFKITSPPSAPFDLSGWKANTTQWGEFTLLEHSLLLPKTAGEPVELSLKLLPFNVGELELPEIEIPFRAAAGERSSVKTPPVKIMVKDPSATAKDGSLRDIKPPVKPLYFWERPSFYIPVVLALGVVSLLIWRQIIKRDDAPAGPAALKNITPEDGFAMELDRFLKLGHVENGRHREFHFGLTAIFRRYVNGRFGLDCEALTSNELLRAMHHGREKLDLQLTAIIELKEALTIQDMAKFAKNIPTPDENNLVLERLSAFVNSHRPAPETSSPQDKGSENVSRTTAIS